MERIIFFDGDCNLCDAFISTLFKIDKKHDFFYASLNSNTAKRYLRQQDQSLDSIVYYHKGETYFEARAVLKILSQLGGVYRFVAQTLSFLPLNFLNFIYKKVAANRYRIFGRKEICRRPSTAESQYFLD